MQKMVIYTDSHNWTKFRQWPLNFKLEKWSWATHLLMGYCYYIIPFKAQGSIHVEDELWEIVRAKVSRQLQENNIFKIQQSWCTCELTENLTAWIRPIQFKGRQNHRQKKTKGIKKFLVQSLFVIHSCYER